jgi:FG-GAP repeat
VSLSALGNVALIGAPDHNGGLGAAYVFVHGSRSWSEHREFQDPGPGPLGTRALVGSPAANSGDGAAFVFDYHSGNWAQTQELTASNPSGADFFGYSVALDYLGNGALDGATETERHGWQRVHVLRVPDAYPAARAGRPGAGSEAQYGFS